MLMIKKMEGEDGVVLYTLRLASERGDSITQVIGFELIETANQ